MPVSKELYIKDEDKFELEMIVAELNAKSLHLFLAEFFRAWSERVRSGEKLPSLVIDKDFGIEGSVKINYLYEEDPAYFLRRAAVQHRTNIAKYLRAMIHWLSEEHRKSGRLWIDELDRKEVPVTRRR